MRISAVRYFCFYVALVMVGLISVSAINYYYDPAHVFSGGEYERDLANLLLSGKNAANISNFDARYMQKCYVSNLNEKKDIIVLGSSRSMQIRSDNFFKHSFFNNSVSGANIEDYLAIYNLYEQHNNIPSIVILGLDPWILKSVKNTGQTSLEEEYTAMMEELNLPFTYLTSPSNNGLIRLKELISLAYLKESIWLVLSGRTNRFYPTDDSDCKNGGILADGSRVYPYNFRNKTIDEVEAFAILDAKSQQTESLKDFTEVDKKRLDILMRFIEHLQQNQVRVIFFLPPYHPTTYRMLAESGEDKIIEKVEACFKNIAKDCGISVIGSYNPENIPGYKKDFYDGLHPKETLIKKVFSSLDL